MSRIENTNSDSSTLNQRMEIRIKGIYALWREWLYSFGALWLVVLLSYFIPKTILPVFVLLLSYLLKRYITPLRNLRVLRCVRITSLTASALTCSAFVMVICLIVVYTSWFGWLFRSELFNPQIPYVSDLIIFTLTMLISGFAVLTRDRSRACRNCKMGMGYTPQDSFAGNLFHAEAIFQMKLMCALSALVATVSWTYYFLLYNNVNYNGADHYVFFFIPTIVFITSLFYTGARYRSLIDTLRHNTTQTQNSTSLLRFIILHGDDMLLQTTQPADRYEYNQADTPAVVNIPYTTTVSDETATREFEKISGLESGQFRMRRVYHNVSIDGHSDIFHYVVTLDADKPVPENLKLNGEWASPKIQQSLLTYNGLKRALLTDLGHIYTITMAWKTYDERGYRRYPVKNYRPTFRLADIVDWDLDYTDPVWLTVAGNNQDHRMFHVRRILRKLVGKK